MSPTPAKSTSSSATVAVDNRLLSDSEYGQVQKLFSDPLSFPYEFKQWLVRYLEASDLTLPTSTVHGIRSIAGLPGQAGPQGPAGPSGPSGPTGPPGPPGAANAAYTGEWTWTTKTADAATAGQVGVNATAWTAVTQVNLNEQKADNADTTAFLGRVKVGDSFYIQQKTDSTRWAKYEITGAGVDHGTWWSWSVTFSDGAGTPPNGNAPTVVSFLTQGAQVEEWLGGSGAPAGTLGKVGDWYLDTANGNVYEKTADTTWTLRSNIKGATGSQGPVGPTGATGTTGSQGPTGATGPQGPQGPQGAAGTGITMKGSVATSANLPPTGNTQGDAYIVQADDSLWIWNGTAWVSGGSIQGPPGAQGPIGATGATGSQGAKGDTGAQGPQGIQGATGTQGATGAQGPQGNTGSQGVAGTPGEKWFTQAGAPAGATGIVGDWSLDSANGDYYEKTGASAWTLRGNLKGPTGATGSQGPQGTTGTTGSQGPQGVKGDTGATGSQGPQGIQGPQGVSGASTFIAGAGAPTAGVGVDGAIYLDTASLRLWGPKASGAWPGTAFARAMPLTPTWGNVKTG